MPKDKVLVVDDEEDLLELLRFNLSKEGYQVSCAASGGEALKSVRADPPDVILLDLMLPDMDGLEVARRLRSDPDTRNVPIVMLTAKGEESDIVTGLELGADDYVTKPFSRKVRVARLRAVLRRRGGRGAGGRCGHRGS
jgi:two-component system phosphate regulon response regulator PhoB